MVCWFISTSRRLAQHLLLFLGCFFSAGISNAADKETTRIVSLVPSLTETCFSIGAGAQVVGVSDFCNYPPEAKTRPHVGGLGNPRLEQLLRLRPTTVFLYRSQADFAEKLTSLDLKCHLFNVDTLNDIYAATAEVGQITGCGIHAHELVSSMSRSFDFIRSRNAAKPTVRAVLLVSRDPTELRNLYQAGPRNFLGEILRIAGGTHAIPGGATITKEQLILGNPEVIIDLSRGERASTPDADKVALTLWAQLSTVSAVKKQRVYYLSDPHALVPGPYLPEFTDKLARLLDNPPSP